MSKVSGIFLIIFIVAVVHLGNEFVNTFWNSDVEYQLPLEQGFPLLINGQTNWFDFEEGEYVISARTADGEPADYTILPGNKIVVQSDVVPVVTHYLLGDLVPDGLYWRAVNKVDFMFIVSGYTNVGSDLHVYMNGLPFKVTTMGFPDSPSPEQEQEVRNLFGVSSEYSILGPFNFPFFEPTVKDGFHLCEGDYLMVDEAGFFAALLRPNEGENC